MMISSEKKSQDRGRTAVVQSAQICIAKNRGARILIPGVGKSASQLPGINKEEHLMPRIL